MISIGPMHLTRVKGEQNILFPCPFSGSFARIWELNGIQYDPSSLPQGFSPCASGLLVAEAKEELSGISIRCLYPKGNGLELIATVA